MPNEVVSAVSGFRPGLPPVKPLYWAAVFGRICPYCAAVTPVRAHAAAEYVGVAPAHGSVLPSRTTDWGANNSTTFGARTARWNVPRTRTSETGAHSTPNL